MSDNIIYNNVKRDKDGRSRDYFCDLSGRDAQGIDEGLQNEENSPIERPRLENSRTDGHETVNSSYASDKANINSTISPSVDKINHEDKYLLYKKLPFVNRKQDIGQWVYNHRLGVSITVIAYLIAIIAVGQVRFELNVADMINGVFIDIPQEQVAEPEKPKEEDEKEQMVVEEIEKEMMSKVKNVAINENAKLDAGLKDDRGTRTQDIYKEAQELEKKLKASQDAFNKGMEEVDEIEKGGGVDTEGRGGVDNRKGKVNETGQQKKGKENTGQASVEKGNVVVSWELKNRDAVHLDIPAYRCEGAGKVVIAITVNRNGDVIVALLSKSSSTNDSCITEMAVNAAKKSRFNVDGKAAEKQEGTITYTFVAQ